MGKASQAKSTRSATSDFLAALERLRTGNPTHPILLERLARGDLKISPTTVALEAGRSRTLIGMVGCKLPDVRSKVLEATLERGTPKLRHEAVKKSAVRVREMQEMIRTKDSALAAAMIRIAKLEARLAKYESTDPKIVSIAARSQPRPKG